MGFGDQLQGMFRRDGLQHVTKGFHHGDVGGRFGGRRGVLRLLLRRRHGWGVVWGGYFEVVKEWGAWFFSSEGVHGSMGV